MHVMHASTQRQKASPVRGALYHDGLSTLNLTLSMSCHVWSRHVCSAGLATWIGRAAPNFCSSIAGQVECCLDLAGLSTALCMIHVHGGCSSIQQYVRCMLMLMLLLMLMFTLTQCCVIISSTPRSITLHQYQSPNLGFQPSTMIYSCNLHLGVL